MLLTLKEHIKTSLVESRSPGDTHVGLENNWEYQREAVGIDIVEPESTQIGAINNAKIGSIYPQESGRH